MFFTCCLLFNRDGFGEVPRLVDVAATGDGGVVGENLERHNGGDGADEFVHIGNLDLVVVDGGIDARAFLAEQNDLRASRLENPRGLIIQTTRIFASTDI